MQVPVRIGVPCPLDRVSGHLAGHDQPNHPIRLCHSADLVKYIYRVLDVLDRMKTDCDVHRVIRNLSDVCQHFDPGAAGERSGSLPECHVKAPLLPERS